MNRASHLRYVNDMASLADDLMERGMSAADEIRRRHAERDDLSDTPEFDRLKLTVVIDGLEMLVTLYESVHDLADTVPFQTRFQRWRVRRALRQTIESMSEIAMSMEPFSRRNGDSGPAE